MLPCEANGDPPPKTRWRRIGPGFPPDGKLKKMALLLTYMYDSYRHTHLETIYSRVQNST